jgi:hypothetical protein
MHQVIVESPKPGHLQDRLPGTSALQSKVHFTK